MTQSSWQEIARTLRVGLKRKIACCSADRSALVSNGHRGVSLYCFRCGRNEFEPHGERSIAEVLATRQATEQLSRQRVIAMPEDAVVAAEGPPEVIVWLLKGGITPEEATDVWGMRWYEPVRRLLIPVRTEGTLVGLLGRAVFGERPKYKMFGGSTDTLFHTPYRPGAPVVVVEDILSAIAVWRAGANGTAVLGTAITPVQAADIASRTDRVIGWFDGDSAGDRAWQRLRQKMSLHPVKLNRIRTKKDPKALHRHELREHLNIGA